MVITLARIDTAEREGACEPALDWLREKPRTVRELIKERPAYAAWALSIRGFLDLIDDDELELLARARPGSTLANACDRISADTFDYCVAARPWTALMHAKHRMSRKQIAYCEKHGGTTAINSRIS